mgnify:CR=1 FL=1
MEEGSSSSTDPRRPFFEVTSFEGQKIGQKRLFDGCELLPCIQFGSTTYLDISHPLSLIYG